MLPFLQDKDGVIAQPLNDSENFGTLDAIAKDMMEAFHKKDEHTLKLALESLCEHLKEEDSYQDQQSLHNKE